MSTLFFNKDIHGSDNADDADNTDDVNNVKDNKNQNNGNHVNNLESTIDVMSAEEQIIIDKMKDARRLAQEQARLLDQLIDIRNKTYNSLNMTEKRILYKELAREIDQDDKRIQREKKE